MNVIFGFLSKKLLTSINSGYAYPISKLFVSFGAVQDIWQISRRRNGVLVRSVYWYFVIGFCGRVVITEASRACCRSGKREMGASRGLLLIHWRGGSIEMPASHPTEAAADRRNERMVSIQLHATFFPPLLHEIFFRRSKLVALFIRSFHKMLRAVMKVYVWGDISWCFINFEFRGGSCISDFLDVRTIEHPKNFIL